MTEGTKPAFEDRLLGELQALVVAGDIPGFAGPEPPSRRGRLVLAGAASVAVLAAGGVLLPSLLPGGHGTQRAYAVARLGDGTVSLAVRGVVQNPGGMQASLRTAGVSVRVFRQDYAGRCHAPRGNLPQPAGLINGLGPDRFVIDPSVLPAGDVLVAQVPTMSSAPVRFVVTRDGLPACPH